MMLTCPFTTEFKAPEGVVVRLVSQLAPILRPKEQIQVGGRELGNLTVNI